MSEDPILIHRVIARLNVGGPAMHVVNLTRALNHGPWRTRLVAGRVGEGEGDMSYYAAEGGVAVTLLPQMTRSISLLDDLATLVRLYRLFRQERPRVVHTHTAKAGTLGRLAAWAAGVPVRVHTFHGHVLGGDYFGRGTTRLYLEIERQLARVTSKLVVLTGAQADEMANVLKVAPLDRFQVVPLGLELERFTDLDRGLARDAVRASLGLASHHVVLGIVGRLVSIKNHELFLDALAALVARGREDVRAVVVGSGDREEFLRARARALNVDDRVHWLGWRRDLPELYAAMDLLLLTSHDEGTPVAVLEALASGTAVLARDVGGVATILGQAGARPPLPKEAGPVEWADAVERALDEPESVDRHAVAARFSVARLASDLERLYRAEIERS